MRPIHKFQKGFSHSLFHSFSTTGPLSKEADELLGHTVIMYREQNKPNQALTLISEQLLTHENHELLYKSVQKKPCEYVTRETNLGNILFNGSKKSSLKKKTNYNLC